QRWVGQNQRLPGMVGRVIPLPHDIDESFTQGGRLKDSAVEKNSLGNSRQIIGSGLLLQERSQMAGDRRIIYIGQPHFMQAGARTSGRFTVAFYLGEKALK